MYQLPSEASSRALRGADPQAGTPANTSQHDLAIRAPIWAYETANVSTVTQTHTCASTEHHSSRGADYKVPHD